VSILRFTSFLSEGNNDAYSSEEILPRSTDETSLLGKIVVAPSFLFGKVRESVGWVLDHPPILFRMELAQHPAEQPFWIRVRRVPSLPSFSGIGRSNGRTLSLGRAGFPRFPDDKNHGLQLSVRGCSSPFFL